MRNFRTAAVAAATAVAVSFTGITAASAEEEQQHEDNASSFVEGSSVLSSDRAQDVLSSENTKESPNMSSKIGDLMNADEDASGSEIFGDEKGNQGDNGDITNPGWARLWRDGNVVAAIGTVVGGIIAAYNYGVYNGFFPHFIQK
ncbi:hypothetical protein [Corynebacterium sp.]|uniref:hypothetical protein n=1 Tax=Corynebacterium sp. TaxID=1720 RepID=UPI0028A90F97|nr:hypothetical protein [Corynebacterium sp.]